MSIVDKVVQAQSQSKEASSETEIEPEGFVSEEGGYAVVQGSRVPIAFLTQRQRQKLGLKNIYDSADALKSKRMQQVREVW